MTIVYTINGGVSNIENFTTTSNPTTTSVTTSNLTTTPTTSNLTTTPATLEPTTPTLHPWKVYQNTDNNKFVAAIKKDSGFECLSKDGLDCFQFDDYFSAYASSYFLKRDIGTVHTNINNNIIKLNKINKGDLNLIRNVELIDKDCFDLYIKNTTSDGIIERLKYFKDNYRDKMNEFKKEVDICQKKILEQDNLFSVPKNKLVYLIISIIGISLIILLTGFFVGRLSFKNKLF